LNDIYELFSVKNKKAVVTGVSSPVGLMYACAEALSQGGAELTIVDVSERCKEAASALGATPVVADLQDADQVESVIPKALQAMGGVDILINGAGMINFNNAEDFAYKEYRKLMMVNLDSAFLLSQAAARSMLEKGYGKIINICSINSYVNTSFVVPYGVSKGALARLTIGLAEEWASKGINVNAIAPGYMKTEFTQDVWGVPERAKSVLAHIPAGRWGQASDMKGATLFLSSAASDYVSGVILAVDGGYLCY
jgi:2-deoxy-D-gluconate 3-dehydrogenase